MHVAWFRATLCLLASLCAGRDHWPANHHLEARAPPSNQQQEVPTIVECWSNIDSKRSNCSFVHAMSIAQTQTQHGKDSTIKRVRELIHIMLRQTIAIMQWSNGSQGLLKMSNLSQLNWDGVRLEDHSNTFQTSITAANHHLDSTPHSNKQLQWSNGSQGLLKMSGFDSSVGRASDWRSEGPVFDSRSKQAILFIWSWVLFVFCFFVLLVCCLLWAVSFVVVLLLCCCYCWWWWCDDRNCMFIACCCFASYSFWWCMEEQHACGGDWPQQNMIDLSLAWFVHTRTKRALSACASFARWHCERLIHATHFFSKGGFFMESRISLATCSSATAPCVRTSYVFVCVTDFFSFHSSIFSFLRWWLTMSDCIHSTTYYNSC